MTRWLRFDDAGKARCGVVEGDQVALHEGDLSCDLARALPARSGDRRPLAGLRWLPPCQPRKVMGLWNNFRAAADKNGWPHPVEPLYFLKSPDCLSAHEQSIAALPAELGRVAYEGELAVVIGRRVGPGDGDQAAASAVFGYTCANDVTAIELLHRDASFVQWTRAKSFAGFGALGPWIDTAFDPSGARLCTRVAGRERQNYLLSDMFFGPLELVQRLAQNMVLEPGDVILCGTSLGVLPMKPGTQVDVEIEGLGSLISRYG